MNKSKFIKSTGPYGLYAFARLLTRSTPRILMYHRFSEKEKKNKVSAATFEQQLVYLKKHFTILSLSELRNYLIEGRKPPANTIVLTVDDGHEDFYRIAFPILKKHKVTATLFVITDFIEQKLWLWTDKITHLLAKDRIINQTISSCVCFFLVSSFFCE